MDQRLRERGTFAPATADRGRQRTVRTPEREERMLDDISEEPGTSTRRIAAAERVSQTLCGSSSEQLLYPYHLQRVQALRPLDYPPRRQFCQWLLQQCARDLDFLSRMFFTDEAAFTRDGIVNFHNLHAWADVSPHNILESRHQQRFSLNIWAGVLGDQLIGLT